MELRAASEAAAWEHTLVGVALRSRCCPSVTILTVRTMMRTQELKRRADAAARGAEQLRAASEAAVRCSEGRFGFFSAIIYQNKQTNQAN